VEAFHEVLTGAVQDRPAMKSLLRYLRKHKREGRVVIIDDISRFARDMYSHWALRAELTAAGGILESPSIKFGEDADSVLHENIMASTLSDASFCSRLKRKPRRKSRKASGIRSNSHEVLGKPFKNLGDRKSSLPETCLATHVC
jgi:site-specific DNA recombinase